MFCRNCGNEVGEDARFCDRCGQPVADGAAETAEAVTEPSSGTVGEHVGSALASARRRIPLALLVVLVALGVASVAFAAYMVWSNVVAPAIEQAERQSGEAPPVGEIVSQGEEAAPANGDEGAVSKGCWVIVRDENGDTYDYDEHGNLTGHIAYGAVRSGDYSYDEYGNELSHTFYELGSPTYVSSVEEKDEAGRALRITVQRVEDTTASWHLGTGYTYTYYSDGTPQSILCEQLTDRGRFLRYEIQYDQDGWMTHTREYARIGPESDILDVSYTYERDADDKVVAVIKHFKGENEQMKESREEISLDENGRRTGCEYRYIENPSIVAYSLSRRCDGPIGQFSYRAFDPYGCR